MKRRKEDFLQFFLPYAHKRAPGRVIGMAGADIGVPQLLTMAHILIANHRPVAIRAPHKPSQNVLGVLQMCVFSELFVILLLFLPGNLLHFFKGLAID